MNRIRAILLFLTGTAFFFGLEYLLQIIGVVNETNFNASILGSFGCLIYLIAYLNMKTDYDIKDIAFTLQQMDKKIEALKDEFASVHLNRDVQVLRRMVIALKQERVLVQMVADRLTKQVQDKIEKEA